jgi:hypothetical protein
VSFAWMRAAERGSERARLACASAEFEVGGRSLEQPREDRLQVEARAPDEERGLRSPPQIAEDGAEVAEVAPGVVALARIDDVDQVVRGARAILRGGLRRPDVHAAVDLHRVHRDDLRARALGDREREPALARRRGADQEAAGKTFEKAAASADSAFHDRVSLAAAARAP